MGPPSDFDCSMAGGGINQYYFEVPSSFPAFEKFMLKNWCPLFRSKMDDARYFGMIINDAG